MYHLLMQTNPYSDLNFFQFLWQLLIRAALFIMGKIPLDQIATDEIQVGVLAGIAISSAMVGCFLILRRMTMLANSLSHTLLMGIVFAYFFSTNKQMGSGASMQAMIVASLIMGFITAFLTEFLSQTAKLQEDASLGLVFTTFFALGVVLATLLTRSAHIGIEAVMGNADALVLSDLWWVYSVLFFNAILYLFFFKEFALTSFDSSLAVALGFSPVFFNYLLMVQVSITSITAFRAVGVLLVLAFMTGPPLTARLLTHSLLKMVLGGAIIGVISAILGVAITRHMWTVYGMALSTSGVVVCTIFFLYFAVAFFTPGRGLLSQMRKGRLSSLS